MTVSQPLSANLVPASELNTHHKALPVAKAFTALFPLGIRRGSTISVRSTSLMLLLIAEPTRAGSWVAITGFPDVGVVAATEMGVSLKRCVFIPYLTANSAPKVFAALIDSVDVVVIHQGNFVQSADARRLIARARDRQCVIILSKTTWQQVSPLTLKSKSSVWKQAANGYGRLKGRWLDVKVEGKGSMSRPQQTSVWLGDGEPITTKVLEAV
jgi:hypothetical protein